MLIHELVREGKIFPSIARRVVEISATKRAGSLKFLCSWYHTVVTWDQIPPFSLV